MTDLAFASAAELAAMIRNREISPIEVMQTTLSRIEESQPILNAFITVAAEPAMEAAKAAEAAVMGGAVLGPLHGVPLAVKDLVPTAGLRTTWGSLCIGCGRRGGHAVEARRGDRSRQDDDTGIRPAMSNRGATLRPDSQRLGRRPQFRRLERRLGGRRRGRACGHCGRRGWGRV